MAAMLKWVVEEILGWIVRQLEGLREFGDWAIGHLLSWAVALLPTVNWASAQEYLDKLNYVFPVSEFVALLTAWLVLWAGVLSYRLFKSWIPLVSGS